MRMPSLLPVIALALSPTATRADGGTVQLTEQLGAYHVTVMTAPAPLRAGPIDVSVLVLDAATKNPISEVLVTLHVAPQIRPDDEMLQPATREAATNKLFHAA